MSEGKYVLKESETEGGVFLTITAVDGLTFEDGTVTKTLAILEDHGPKVGQRVMCGRQLIKVKQRWYDEYHNLWLMDEDTKATYKWIG